MVGVNIDTFHKNPAHQANLLASFTSTYVANLEIGGRYMRVSASPVINDRGERLGAVAEWLDRTSEVLVEKEVANIVDGASGATSMTRHQPGRQGRLLPAVGRRAQQAVRSHPDGLTDVARVLQRVAQAT
jgi:methyl-accepting chemotaxis protein